MDLFDLQTEQDEAELAAAGWKKAGRDYFQRPGEVAVVHRREAMAWLDAERKKRAGHGE